MKVLREFGFLLWEKPLPPNGHYVRVVRNGEHWIMQTTKEERESKYRYVVDAMIDEQEPRSRETQVSNGGDILEDGTEIEFSDGTILTVSRSTIVFNR
jgi:hypothetical protein